MFDGIDEQRVLGMKDQEKRLLDNIKKAFHESDKAVEGRVPEHRSLEELFKAIDTAKTLRRSLRGEDISHKDNKKRFIAFLGLEIPMCRTDGYKTPLRDVTTGETKEYTFGEIVYAIRCKVHENENLNAAEGVEYHILLDWSVPDRFYFPGVRDGRFYCNGWFLWHRLREVLAKFITCIEDMVTLAKEGRSSASIQPKLGSIRPDGAGRRENGT